MRILYEGNEISGTASEIANSFSDMEALVKEIRCGGILVRDSSFISMLNELEIR